MWWSPALLDEFEGEPGGSGPEPEPDAVADDDDDDAEADPNPNPDPDPDPDPDADAEPTPDPDAPNNEPDAPNPEPDADGPNERLSRMAGNNTAQLSVSEFLAMNPSSSSVISNTRTYMKCQSQEEDLFAQDTCTYSFKTILL